MCPGKKFRSVCRIQANNLLNERDHSKQRILGLEMKNKELEAKLASLEKNIDSNEAGNCKNSK